VIAKPVDLANTLTVTVKGLRLVRASKEVRAPCSARGTGKSECVPATHKGTNQCYDKVVTGNIRDHGFGFTERLHVKPT
jgi:hypothetical protein